MFGKVAILCHFERVGIVGPAELILLDKHCNMQMTAAGSQRS